MLISCSVLSSSGPGVSCCADPSPRASTDSSGLSPRLRLRERSPTQARSRPLAALTAGSRSGSSGSRLMPGVGTASSPPTASTWYSPLTPRTWSQATPTTDRQLCSRQSPQHHRPGEHRRRRTAGRRRQLGRSALRRRPPCRASCLAPNLVRGDTNRRLDTLARSRWGVPAGHVEVTQVVQHAPAAASWPAGPPDPGPGRVSGALVWTN